MKKLLLLFAFFANICALAHEKADSLTKNPAPGFFQRHKKPIGMCLGAIALAMSAKYGYNTFKNISNVNYTPKEPNPAPPQQPPVSDLACQTDPQIIQHAKRVF